MPVDTRLESKLAEMSRQVDALTLRVTQLESAVVNKAPVALAPKPAPSPKAITESSGETSILIDSSSLLKLISIQCFLLVAALALRELPNSGMLDAKTGSILGIIYAAVLILCGQAFYRKKNSLAPFFCVTGAIVMFSVMVESHARFSALPEEIGYILLALTGIGMALISYMNRVALPIIVGTLGMCIAAMAIGYPTPYYPYLGLMLWASNILGYFATRLKRCSWLRWFLLITTHFMLQVWGLKISGLILHGQEKVAHLSPGLYIPVVTLIGFTFMMISVFGIIRSGNEKVSRFDFSVPAVNAGWCYIAGIYALKNPPAFGAPAAAAAVIHFGLAYWLSRRKKSHAQGTNTFTAGGIILACLSLPALFNSMFLPLPILSLLAITTCYFSNRWSSGGMRVSSYLLQIYISIVFCVEFIFEMGDEQRSPAILVVTLFCSAIAVGHYYYARGTRLPEHSQIFGRYDKKDQSALLPLFAGLTNAFFACMILAYFALRHYYQEDMTLALTGVQSIIINIAAIFIMIRAFFNDNTELRNVSFLVLLIGGSKVFIIDMFTISGSWLVCSIFTFGTAAALASLVLARWKPAPPPEKSPIQSSQKISEDIKP